MLEGFNTSHILIVGPSYKEHRGGIGSVIEGYSKTYAPFCFFSTYSTKNRFIVPILSLLKLIYFPFYLLLRKRIEIVHIHGASRGSFFRKFIIFFISKWVFRKKVIYHIHGAEFHLFYEQSSLIVKNIIRFFINTVDTVICLSESWKVFFKVNFNCKNLEVVPNVVDKVNFRNKELKKSDKVIFLFLGRIGKRKGVFDIIDVVSKLRDTQPSKFEIWIGGDGDLDSLKTLVENKELTEYVKILGWVTGEKKLNILSQADVFLLPSFNEGLPVSILEAMSYSLPVISTKVGGIPELVQDEVSGFLIEPGDIDALNDIMEVFICNREIISSMGRNASSIIQQKFTTEVAMQKLSKIYDLLRE